MNIYKINFADWVPDYQVDRSTKNPVICCLLSKNAPKLHKLVRTQFDFRYIELFDGQCFVVSNFGEKQFNLELFLLLLIRDDCMTMQTFSYLVLEFGSIINKCQNEAIPLKLCSFAFSNEKIDSAKRNWLIEICEYCVLFSTVLE